MGVSAELPRSARPLRFVSGRTRVWNAYRAELRKLMSQVGIRVLALICVLGPFAFAAVLKLQSSVPGDTLFGVWVHGSGFAIPMVILSFAGQWGFPVIAGVVAGDICSSEDRHGTWKMVLTRSRSRGELFAGKLLAASALTVAIAVLTAVASIGAGLIIIGDQSMVGLSGQLISPGRALLLVVASWALNLLPLLGFVALAFLFSCLTRNGILGVLGPVLVALVMQLLGLIGNGSWLHTLLLATGFGGWHGLFTRPAFFGPLVAGVIVSVAWITAGVLGSWLAVRRRDFAGVVTSRRPGWRTAARIAFAGAAVLILLTAATSWGPGAISVNRLQHSFAPTFNQLTLLQQKLLGRHVAPGAKLDALTSCSRRAGASPGPGDDWLCTVDVLVPGSGATPVEQSVSYDVSVQSNGCYKADAPPSFVGSQTMRVPGGHMVVNPLFTIYGCFNPL